MHAGLTAMLAEAQSLMGAGQWLQAEAILRRALLQAPDERLLHLPLGIVCLELGRAADAVVHLERAARGHDGDAVAQFYLGVGLSAAGRHEHAAKALAKAVRADGTLLPAVAALGGVLLDLGRYEEAGDCFARAQRLDPSRLDFGHDQGFARLKGGRIQDAIASFAGVLARDPAYGPAHANLANAFMRQGDLGRAIVHAKAAVSLDPRHPTYRDTLVKMLFGAQRHAAAEACARQAVALAPGDPAALASLVPVLRLRGRLLAAERLARRCLAIMPQAATCHMMLSGCLSAMGLAAEALDHSRQALALGLADPADISAHLALLAYAPGSTAEGYKVEAQALLGRIFAGLAPSKPVRPRATPRIRIGYVSGDLRRHSVSFFLLPVLRHHDRGSFAIEAFSTTPSRDEMTDEIGRHLDALHDISGLSPDQAAARIRAAEIDVLIDLSGHTHMNALPVFARRAAPVQATWLGYYAGTGLETMDYWITDKVLHPVADQEPSTERKWRLDRTIYAYDPPAAAPPVRPRPLHDGVTTFASFNNISKLLPQTISLFARVLVAVPASRMLIKSQYLDDPDLRRRLMAQFGALGVDADRLHFLPPTKDHAEHLDLYNQVDIVLDSTPYTGATSTADALWMGTPVLSLAGSRMVERQSATIIDAVGLSEWIASSPAEYIEKATAFAADRIRLAAVHATLRDRMRASPLVDGPGLAAALEVAYREMMSPASSRSRGR